MAREVKAVDMEISGIFESARFDTGDLPVIVRRGLSDIIGFKRDTRWTEYACHSAASFCVALLTSGVISTLPHVVTPIRAVEQWLLTMLRQSPETRPSFILKDSQGSVVGVLLTRAEYELLNAAAEIARNPLLWESLRRTPKGRTLSLEEVFGPKGD
jgi:hypothetical protein